MSRPNETIPDYKAGDETNCNRPSLAMLTGAIKRFTCLGFLSRLLSEAW